MVIFYKYRYFVGANAIKIIGKGPTHRPTWTEVLFFSITYQYERYIIVFHIHMRGERVLRIKLVHCLYIYWKWESYFQHCYRFIIIKTELGLKNVWHFKKYINFLFLYFYSFFLYSMKTRICIFFKTCRQKNTFRTAR